MRSQSDNGGRMRAISIIVLAIAVSSGGVVVAVGPGVASASSANSGGYPYASMPCVWKPYASTGHGYWCKDYDWGAIRKNASSKSIESPYGYDYRNCTDYVAWKLASLGVSPTKYRGLGNALTWGTRAKKVGVINNSTPAVGAVAISTVGSFGHIAFVTSVNGPVLTVAEYNEFRDGTYSDTRKGTAAQLRFTSFDHFEAFEITVATQMLPRFSVGKPYVSQVVSSGGTGKAIWSIASGSLPDGIALASDGDIAGTPTRTKRASFTLRVRDSVGDKAMARFVISSQPVLNPTIKSFVASVTGQTVSFKLHVVDGNSVGLWDGDINYVCNDPTTGARTGTVGFVWFANPKSASAGSSTSLVSGTLNDGIYDPNISAGIYGICQPYQVDISDQDGGYTTYGSGDPSNPSFPFSATFTIPPP